MTGWAGRIKPGDHVVVWTGADKAADGRVVELDEHGILVRSQHADCWCPRAHITGIAISRAGAA